MRISDWSSDVCSSDLGNNADSPLAGRLPPEDFVEDRKAQEQAVDYDSFRIMAFYAAVYYLVRALFSTPRQARLFHRRVSVCVEIACWIRNAWRDRKSTRLNSSH